MSVSIDKVLSMLRTFEHGATTKQLAAKLGMKPASLASRLSKRFLYGKLDREAQTIKDSRGRYDEYIWRAI